ncbi:hypothetical protein AB0D32_01100 [Micromonospora sp. NPDC048170]|uniref:hypothetical protein n=1 Tax=Micromonospora sp. NPDC048170 TaxID=3154819 RepID=UPI0033E15ACB
MTESAAGRGWFGGVRQEPDVGLPPDAIVAAYRREFAGLALEHAPVALRPIVVTQGAYRELLQATESLLRLLARAAHEVGPDRAARARVLSVTDQDCPVFGDDEDFEQRHWADMARADVVVGPQGPMFVEFNVSGTFEGLLDFHALLETWQRVREAAGRPAYVAVDPFPGFAGLVRRVCAELEVPPELLFVGTRRMWGSDVSRRYYLRKTALLRRHGVHAEQVEFADLSARPGLARRVAVFDFTAADGRAEGFDLSPVWQAVRAGMRLVPSQSAWFLHSKKLLALLSEGMDWMDARQRELVDRYVPWSRVLGERKVLWAGRHHDLPRLLAEQQHQMVIKHATGDAGRQVTFGARTAPADWRRLVERACASGDHVAQQVVSSVPYPVEVIGPDGQVTRVRADAVVSPFCIGGSASGCHAKFVTHGEPGVISISQGAVSSCLVAES